MKIIEIVPYDENWPREFARIAGPLRATLREVALRIDHIGSTSVPGLAAKDIIDVQVTVRDFDVPLEAVLSLLGYMRVLDINGDHLPPQVLGPASEWEKRYFQPPEGSAAHPFACAGAGTGEPTLRAALSRLSARLSGSGRRVWGDQACSRSLPSGELGCLLRYQRSSL